jgi:hypothetical protein
VIPFCLVFMVSCCVPLSSFKSAKREGRCPQAEISDSNRKKDPEEQFKSSWSRVYEASKEQRSSKAPGNGR